MGPPQDSRGAPWRQEGRFPGRVKRARTLVKQETPEVRRGEARWAMTNREFFLQRWEEEYPTFCKVFRALPTAIYGLSADEVLS